MSHIDTINTARALHWSMMNRKNYTIATPERHNFSARLHSGPLLGENELAAREITARLGERRLHGTIYGVTPATVDGQYTVMGR